MTLDLDNLARLRAELAAERDAHHATCDALALVRAGAWRGKEGA